jgi:hypothetical protein
MAGSGRPLLTFLTRVYIDEKAAYRKAGTQPSMAERRGAGGPPDGHDPEALPHAAPLLAKFLHRGHRAISIQQQACHFPILKDTLLKNPK